jgi:hypothetical protein
VSESQFFAQGETVALLRANDEIVAGEVTMQS